VFVGAVDTGKCEYLCVEVGEIVPYAWLRNMKPRVLITLAPIGIVAIVVDVVKKFEWLEVQRPHKLVSGESSMAWQLRLIPIFERTLIIPRKDGIRNAVIWTSRHREHQAQ
jgi:hypothetical protein